MQGAEGKGQEAITIGSSRYRQANLALFCAGFITFVTLYDIQPLLPLFTREFNISPAISSLPLSISTATLAIGMLFSGLTSDAIGRKPIMVAALILTSLLAIATAFSTTLPSLLLIRFAQGAVLAGVPSVAMAYLGEEMDSSAIASAMGLYISGNAVGGMSGRVITAIMADYMPWRTAIGIIGCVSLLLAFWFIKLLPRSSRFQKRSLDLRTLFPSLLHHLKDPGMLCLFGVAFLCMGCFISLYNYIGFRLLLKPFSLSQSIISLIFLVYFLGSLSSAMMGRLMQRFGRRFVIRATITAMACGALFTLADSLVSIVTGIALFTCGFFGVHSIASGWVSRRATSYRAQASSLYLFSYYLGSSISGTLGGYFWVSYAWTGVAAMICLLLLAAFGCTELLSRSYADRQA
ncbi:MAG: MFS transporter [Trichlorobacter sp.]|uniref:MFS transporter n=1 Tax=Trichlorobacter sp. TaxID=2911007 RepID=UPI002564AD1C|nr:MFS transporter [Trichlorobacter sp.]MDK9718639.1 MFS transporter [Trichlorobacter sp.]